MDAEITLLFVLDCANKNKLRFHKVTWAHHKDCSSHSQKQHLLFHTGRIDCSYSMHPHKCDLRDERRIRVTDGGGAGGAVGQTNGCSKSLSA
mmetsp:Transcript_17936/g.29930  ORF Transcript_17936/g.29930 Transcript_17936/m.29930 type:complete len:92 (+) Transcript_17936:126-401(+)